MDISHECQLNLRGKMNQDLINQMIFSVFRFKQIETSFRLLHPDSRQSVSIAELTVLKGIKDSAFESGELKISDLLCISRSAVSQMLGAMEQKGYITREIDRTNRRKHSIFLTPKGGKVVEEQEQKCMDLIAGIAEKFGEKEIQQLIKLSGHLMDIVEEIKTEAKRKGAFYAH
jgi:DNA-binding MarR family transcriptional regulator